jgi:hypothetical protein
MSPARTTVLGAATVAAAVSLFIFVVLDVTRHLAVDVDIVIGLTGLMVCCGIGYVAAAVGNAVVAKIDEHDRHMMMLHESQAEVRQALGGFADAVVDYGVAKVAEDRLDQIRVMAAHTTINGHAVHLQAVPKP